MNSAPILTRLALSCFLGFHIAPRVFAQSESYFLYTGNHPDQAKPGWHHTVQGVGHDQDHWYVTDRNGLWKIPVSHDLSQGADGVRGVQKTSWENLRGVTDLAGYDHFGDLEHYEYEGRGYVFVAIEGAEADRWGAVAVFRAENLAYLDLHPLNVFLPPFEFQIKSAPWCALSPGGDLLASTYDGVKVIKRFRIDWEKLDASGELHLEVLGGLHLQDELGQELTLSRVQGGVVSPSGALLYLVAGGVDTFDFQAEPTDGIHVFEVATGRRVRRSTNGSGPFNYQFDTGPPKYEEPEGLTIWDLDDGRAPGIRGQLHVLLGDFDSANNKQVYLKHYTHTIHVDRDYSGPESGTPARPFNTVGEGNELAWNGSRILIHAGSYPEQLVFNKAILVLATNGSAVIGTPSRN